jgi:hypothetical protein
VLVEKKNIYAALKDGGVAVYSISWQSKYD